MHLPSVRRIHRLPHRAIAAAVALSLLSMPVTYRGGADAAHAHTIFRLWEDVRIGSFTHHAPDDEPDRPYAEAAGGHAAAKHGDRPGQEAGGGDTDADHGATIDPDGAGGRKPARGSPTGAAESERAGGVASTRMVDVQRDDRAPVVVEADPDAPVASSAFTPSVRGTMLVLPAAATWPQAESFGSASRPAHRLSGVTDSPTAPPPRRAA